jgi:pyridoxal phosphate enzyme (YggS family)
MTPSSPDPVDPSSAVAARFEAVRRRISRACRIAGRDAAGVALVAVTKTQPPEAIESALAAGQRLFGENRVQEAQGRWAGRDRSGLELRLIGPLQTNKAADAVALFDVIETVDREKLVDALAAAALKAGRSLRVRVPVNTGAEAQKAGVLPEAADALVAYARRAGLQVEGLMCIPPAEEAAGPHFALLRKIARRNGLEALSMGMSGDYEVAIRFGATHVRIGSALFGERNRPDTPSMEGKPLR